MAGGRWEWGTGQLAGFAEGVAQAIQGRPAAMPNPFKPPPAPPPERLAAAREAESKAGWAALREAMKGVANDYRRKHGHKTATTAGNGAPTRKEV